MNGAPRSPRQITMLKKDQSLYRIQSRTFSNISKSV